MKNLSVICVKNDWWVKNDFLVYICVFLCVCVRSNVCVYVDFYIGFSHIMKYLFAEKICFTSLSHYFLVIFSFLCFEKLCDEFAISTLLSGETSTVCRILCVISNLLWESVCSRGHTAASENAHFAFLRASFATRIFARMWVPLSWWEPNWCAYGYIKGKRGMIYA